MEKFAGEESDDDAFDHAKHDIKAFWGTDAFQHLDEVAQNFSCCRFIRFLCVLDGKLGAEPFEIACFTTLLQLEICLHGPRTIPGIPHGHGL